MLRPNVSWALDTSNIIFHEQKLKNNLWRSGAPKILGGGVMYFTCLNILSKKATSGAPTKPGARPNLKIYPGAPKISGGREVYSIPLSTLSKEATSGAPTNPGARPNLELYSGAPKILGGGTFYYQFVII